MIRYIKAFGLVGALWLMASNAMFRAASWSHDLANRLWAKHDAATLRWMRK